MSEYYWQMFLKFFVKKLYFVQCFQLNNYSDFYNINITIILLAK